MSKLITLVNTNQVKPAIAPIAFDYLSTPLRHAGFNVELLDLCFSDDYESQIVAYCRRQRPDYWGVTLRNTDDVYFASGFNFLQQIKHMVELLRQEADVPITMGGVGFSVMPEKILDYMGIDFGVVTEGEFSFPELLTRLESSHDVSDISGLVFRDGPVIRRNPIAKNQFGDLKGIGSHARELVDNPLYFEVGGQIGIETKRGCNRRCIYCVEPLAKGQQVRLRDPVHVVDEMEHLVHRGVNVFHINDSEFNLSISHPIALCEEICKRGLQSQIQWYAYGMPAPFPDKLAAAMRKAGCVGMNFGVDSACDKMLKVLRRTFSPRDIENAVNTAKRHGLEHIVELLFGAPGETKETIRETIDFVKRIDPDRVSVTVGLRIFPGTELERMIRSEGLTLMNRNLYGEVSDNEDLLKPIFYLPHELGDDPLGYISELIGGDPRFFGANSDRFNYNANDVLVNAIRNGERGAYWSILSRVEKQWQEERDRVASLHLGFVEGQRSCAR